MPDLVEDPRLGDQSGTGVKGETVDLVDVGAAAQFVPLFVQIDLMTAGCQSKGSAQTAEAEDSNDGQKDTPGADCSEAAWKMGNGLGSGAPNMDKICISCPFVYSLYKIDWWRNGMGRPIDTNDSEGAPDLPD